MKYLNILIISVKIRYNNILLNRITRVKQDVLNALSVIERYEEEAKNHMYRK